MPTADEKYDDRRSSKKSDAACAPEKKEQPDRAGEVLQRERDQFRLTLARIQEGVIITDAGGELTFMNPAAEHLTGWKFAETAGHSIEEVFNLVDERTLQPIRNPMKEGRLIELTDHTILIGRNGTETPINYSTTPVRDDGAIAVFQEVGQKGLREWARLSALRADIASQLASSTQLDYTLQKCCELLVVHLGVAFARIWTVLPDEPVLALRASAGMYTHLNGPHARVPVGKYKIGRIARDQRAHLTNTVATDPNISDPEWARKEEMAAFAGYPLLAEGRTVGVLAMFSRQVLSSAILDDLAPIADSIAQCIERKRAETELRLATEQAEASARAVSESAERFRLLSEIASIQVWTAGPDGALDFVNQECGKYFGTEEIERDILGNAWAQYVHPEDLPQALERWQRCLETLEAYEVEFRLRDRHGEYRWFLTRAQAMRVEAGAAAKWLGTNTDIHALKMAKSQAEGASRAKDDFIAALSHELRTPLTPVLMAAAALKDDESLSAAVREQLAMMERNIALEARLIDDLLDLTRIARGKLDFRSQVCDAHSLIELAIEIILDDALAKSITIRREFAAKSHMLLADPVRFQQVIWNLLRNAVKFTPSGGEIMVRTSDQAAGEDGPLLRIEVADSGIGIDPARLEEIFLPFEQGSETWKHQFGGVGLGLAIAKAIVDLHDGRIHAESKGMGCGATFVVELPGAVQKSAGITEAAAPVQPDQTSGAQSSASPPRRRLLLVEDHEPTLQVLTRLLVRAGHEVIVARTMAEALAAAAANTVDFVISDLGLPDGTGVELMSKLRERHGLIGIALSGYGMDEDIERSRQAGFVAHLIKPVDFHQLERTLAGIA